MKILSFIVGLLCMALVFAVLEDHYENRFFIVLAERVAGHSRSVPDDTVFVRALHLCHVMLAARGDLFACSSMEASWIDRQVHPLSSDLISADGACGSYAVVLCRMMQVLHFKVRLAQMTDSAGRVCHILVEVQGQKGWIVMDPLYDLYFKTCDGRLASFDEVHCHWSYYRSQVPADYNARYDYSGVRYTNWDRLPMLKTFLGLFMDKTTIDHLSIRTYFLRKFRVLEFLVLLPLLVITTVMTWYAIKKVASNADGLYKTVANYYKIMHKTLDRSF